MSEQASKGFYVYQPYGLGDSREKTGRLYGLGGLPPGVECKGLTKDEAETLADALNDICWMTDRCASCGHRFRFESSACPQCGEGAIPPWQEPEPWPDTCECERCEDARKGSHE